MLWSAGFRYLSVFSIFICKQRFLLGLFIFYLVKLEDVRDFILDDLYGKYAVQLY